MHIALMTDGAGFEGARLTIRSILHASSPVCIHVVDGGLDATQAASLRALSDAVCIVAIPDDARNWLKDFSLHGKAHVSHVAYAKLQLHRILANVERVLYLDIDTLVMQDLAPLFDTALGNARVGATWNVSQREAGRDRLGLKQHYFNSGVMLCPLSKWREECIELEFSSWYTANSRAMQFNDQEVLNGVCAERVHWLDKRWNVSHWEILRRHNQIDIPPEECRIIHFNGPTKPWHAHYVRDIVINQQAYASIAARLAECGVSSEQTLHGATAQPVPVPVPVQRALADNTTPRIGLTVTCDPLRFHLLPQFVEHYRAYGVDDFYINLHFDVSYNGDEKEQHLQRADAILSAYDLQIHSTYSCMFTAMAIREHHDAIIAKIGARTPWIVAADMDEFHEFPDALPALATFMTSHGIGYVRGRFVDRLARQGFPDFRQDISIWKQYPLGTDMTRSIVGGWVDKVMFARAGISLRPGHHATTPQETARALGDVFAVHHFKWDSSVIERLKRRLLDDWKKTCPWWTQSDKALSWIEGAGSEGLSGLSIFDFEDDTIASAGGPHSNNPRYRAHRSPRNRWATQH
jgi:lipopolysaccharide biosynthesis glycosyltransferase